MKVYLFHFTGGFFMSKKQLFNKKESFSIRKYSFGAASILVGSLLFLGGGHAFAAETTEVTTHETTSIEHIQSKQESTSTQEGSNTKEISTTQEPFTTESTSNTQGTPSTQEVKSTEETPSSQETTSIEETPSSEESQSNTITTREEPSTEQPSSTKDIHTKEIATTETSKPPAIRQSIKTQPETSQQQSSSTDTKAQSSTPSKLTSTKKETIPSSNKETSTQEQLSTQESKPTSHKSVVQDAKEDNVTPVHENISTYSNQISAQLAPKADTTSTVASTSESKVNIQDIPKTEFKNLTSNEKKYCIKRYNKMRIHKINNPKPFFQQHQCGRLRNVQKIHLVRDKIN